MYLVLETGVNIELLKGDSIAFQYDTPQLEHMGNRDWMGEIARYIVKYNSGEKYVNPSVIIGKFGSVYGSTEGVRYEIPLKRILAIGY